jgi:hypothetical protein
MSPYQLELIGNSLLYLGQICIVQRSSYVNQINFGPEVDLIDSPQAQS